MGKTLRYGFLVIQMLWEACGIFAGVSIFSKIYSQTFFPLLQVYLLADILDLLTYHRSTLHIIDFLPIMLIYILGGVLDKILDGSVKTRDMVFDYRLQDYIERKIVTKLSTLDPATFEDPKFQELLAQIAMMRYHVNEFMTRFLAMINGVVMFITAAIVVGVSFPYFIPIVLIATIPSFMALQNYRKAIYPFLLEERPKMARISEYLKNLFSQDSTSKEVAIFNNAKLLITKLIFVQTGYMNKFTKTLDKVVIYVVLTDILQFFAFLATQFYNLVAVLSGKLLIGQFTLIFQQTMNLAAGASQTLDHYSAANTRCKYLDQYYSFLAYPRFIKTPDHPIPIPNALVPCEIEFKNVSFRYPGTNRDIFKNLDLKISSGEKIALVGENGAGKSTLIKLLLRFYDVTEGEILLNGVNIKEIDIKEWYKMIGALFQDFIKYQFTFKENVYFGDLTKNNNLEFLQEAIKKSGADNYVKELPKGIDQTVGKMFDGGIDLSGGQWQKLALARAFFRDAPILILDEPTAAIDAKAEYEIFENVQKLQKDKTVIIISHRFSTVRNADRILVLDEGRIVEEGNHEKLMKKKGLYAELFNLQAQGYK